MAAAALRTWAWIAAAAAALALLLALALGGARPEAGLSRFQPAGVMLSVPPASATAVEVSRAGRSWRFARDGGGWRAEAGNPPGPTDPAPALELGLRLLHGSAPQRELLGSDLEGLVPAEIGLDPPLLSVRVEAGPACFAVDLGGPNPQGLARYARVAGRPGLLLLNGFVADPWLDLSGGR